MEGVERGGSRCDWREVLPSLTGRQTVSSQGLCFCIVGRLAGWGGNLEGLDEERSGLRYQCHVGSLVLLQEVP